MEQAQLQQIAQGYGIGGEQWTLVVQLRRGRLRTMVQVQEPDGHRWTAGLDGHPVTPGRRTTTFEGRSSSGALLYLLRVAPEVRAAVATLSDGTREDLQLHGDRDVLGARVAVLTHPRGTSVTALQLLDDQGAELPEVL